MNRPEQALQRSVVQLLEVRARRVLWWHTPNGGARRPAEASIMRGLGVRPGVPDITLVLNGGRVAQWELKAQAGRVSEAQASWMERLLELGGRAEVVRSVDDAIRLLDGYAAEGLL